MAIPSFFLFFSLFLLFTNEILVFQRLEVMLLKELLELKATRGYSTTRSSVYCEYSVPASPHVKSMRRLIRTNSVPNNSTLSRLANKYRIPIESNDSDYTYEQS